MEHRRLEPFDTLKEMIRSGIWECLFEHVSDTGSRQCSCGRYVCFARRTHFWQASVPKKSMTRHKQEVHVENGLARLIRAQVEIRHGDSLNQLITFLG